MKCKFPNCSNHDELEPHHIIYIPKTIVMLCCSHHQEITAINAHQARKQNTPLSNPQRWFLWYAWIQGRLKKPRITHLDKEWSERA